MINVFSGQFRDPRWGLEVDLLEECNKTKLCKHPNKELLKVLNCSKGNIRTKFGTLGRGSNFNIGLRVKNTQTMTPQSYVSFLGKVKKSWMFGENVQKVFCSRTVMLQFLIS